GKKTVGFAGVTVPKLLGQILENHRIFRTAIIRPSVEYRLQHIRRGTPASAVTLDLLQMRQRLRVSIPPKN
ncbi:MAG: hypothetical protein ACKPJA_24295, partial [Microcystis panniformis]